MKMMNFSIRLKIIKVSVPLLIKDRLLKKMEKEKPF